MADTSNFADNFKTLKDLNAIPHDVSESHISQSVKEAISGFSKSELTFLADLAKKTKSHLFLHDNQNHVIAMGL